MRVYFELPPKPNPNPYVCKNELSETIESMIHKRVNVIVAQHDDGRCAGFAWVSFGSPEDKHACRGRHVVLRDVKGRFEE